MAEESRSRQETGTATASAERHKTRLRDLRMLRHESQQQVATALGVPLSTYGAWERGKRELRAENIKVLARYFKVTPNEILDFGEVAVKIPHLDSELERFIAVYMAADPQMRNIAMAVLTTGAKKRHPSSRSHKK